MVNNNLYNVIIDTNVIVSAIISKNDDSPTVKILDLLFNDKINVYFSDEIINEYIDVLNREKFKFDNNLVKTIIDTIISNGKNISPKSIDVILKDMKDKPFYELVMDETINDSKLITGNIKHFPIQTNIMTPREFIDMYEGKIK